MPAHGSAAAGPCSAGDRDDDAFGDVDEQLGHPRFGAGEFTGGVEIVGLDDPEVVEGTDGRVRVIGASGVVSGTPSSLRPPQPLPPTSRVSGMIAT
ncbi:hypothetical protein [Streptomyces torulosus]|uniref:hypothetical protein n=1 Tax=Streptomyces torulosus TaxID=68276 RepID=UPI000AA203F1|nr:hypothetical protein [Streptomyces torulosus]